MEVCAVNVLQKNKKVYLVCLRVAKNQEELKNNIKNGAVF